MKTYLIKALLLSFISLSLACQDEFLEAKPDRALLVPTTLADMQALLDNYNVINTAPYLGVVSCDDIYTTDAGWEGATPIIKAAYIWEKDIYKGEATGDWNNGYQQIFYANVVLNGLKDFHTDPSNFNNYNQIKGSALFIRAMAHFALVQLFSKAYHPANANQDLGIPVRISSDVNEVRDRGTVQQTYNQIISDLKEAGNLLAVTASYKTRPTKQAALGLLARVYQTMQNYEQAEIHASACLSIKKGLIDYNGLSASATRPIPSPLPNGNDEVLFYTPLAGLSFLTASSLTMIDQELYQSYDNNDLRKSIYFRDRGNGVITFKGNYSGTSSVFAGIAIDEIYLIRSEAYARMGNVPSALNDLNTLLIKRWNNQVPYSPYSITSAEEALGKILTERRKELVYRNLRWTDLKRLNLDPKFAKPLKRVIKGVEYSLSPNDNRYVFAIPDAEISNSGLAQNNR